MRILLTGATGEIGLPLVDALCERRHELHVLTRQNDRPPRAGVHWCTGNLTEPESLRNAVACEPELVVHMAAVTHSRSAAEYERINVAGTTHLLGVLRGTSTRHFVHMSTRAIGADGGAYAAAKMAAEAVVRAGDIPWSILRPAEVYGGGGSDPILDLARDLQRRSFVPILGDGRYRLAPVAAADVVAAVVNLCELERPTHGQCYVLAGPEELSYLELVARLESILSLPKRRRVHVPVWLASIAIRILSTLGAGSYVPDQVARLLLQKDSDSALARAELGFAPRALAEVLPELLL